MKKLAFAIFLISFLLFRPHMLQHNGMWYPGDDQEYFAHASSIVFGEFPSYKEEFFTHTEEMPVGSIGCGLLASPFVWDFSLVDRLEGAEIVQKRSYQTISKSWSQFGFVFASVFYFCLANFLLFFALRKLIDERYALMAIIFSVLIQGIPLFIYRRPIFSNGFEFSLQMIALSLLLMMHNAQPSKPKISTSIGIGFLSVCIFLTRYNNIFMALVWMLILLKEQSHPKLRNYATHLGISLSIFIMATLIFVVYPTLQQISGGYARMIPGFLEMHPPLFYLDRLYYIFTGLDWGLIYTAPFLVLGIIALIRGKHPLKKQFIYLGLAALVNLYLVIVWQAHGAWYGYRNLICTLIPITIVPIAFLFKGLEQKYQKNLLGVWVIVATLPFLSMFFFEGFTPQLNIEIVLNRFNKAAHSNNFYQFYVWQTFLFDFRDAFTTITMAGPRYIVYLFNLLKSFVTSSEPYFDRRYPVFDGITLLRTLIIYSVPFIMAGIFSNFKGSKKS